MMEFALGSNHEDNRKGDFNRQLESELSPLASEPAIFQSVLIHLRINVQKLNDSKETEFMLGH